MNNQKLRDMQKSDLTTVFEWRNHLNVRKFMFTQHEIAWEEHLEWFKKLEWDSFRHALIFEEDGLARGFANINLISPDSNVANWGFYTAPDAIKGTGRRLGQAVLSYAFSTLNLKKICGQALSYNKASIHFHQALGFSQEGILREQYFDGEKNCDIFCFGLLKNEWPL